MKTIFVKNVTPRTLFVLAREKNNLPLAVVYLRRFFVRGLSKSVATVVKDPKGKKTFGKDVPLKALTLRMKAISLTKNEGLKLLDIPTRKRLKLGNYLDGYPQRMILGDQPESGCGG